MGTVAVLAAACTGSGDPIATVDDGRFRNPWGEVCEAPCLFGAVVGETTLDSAEERLRAHSLLAGISPNRYPDEVRFHGTEGSVWVRADARGIVETIWVGVEDGSISYGDVLATMGEPSAVHFFLRPGTTSLGYMSWFYDGIIVTSWLDEPSFGRDDTVDNLDLRATEQVWPIFPVALNAISFIQYEVPAWLGFGDVERYLTDDRCRVVEESVLFAGASCPQ